MHGGSQTQAPLPFTRIGFWAMWIVSSSLIVAGTHVINRRETPSLYDEGLLLRTPLNKDLPLCIGCSIGTWPFWNRHLSKGNLGYLDAAATSFSIGYEKLLLC